MAGQNTNRKRIVYMTINCVNGRRYIGRDSRNTSWYLGGGTLLRYAIKKYGKENFIKITLCECDSTQELIDKEKYYLDLYEASINPSFYNLSPNSSDGCGIRFIDNRRPVHQYTLEGVYVASYSSQKEAARKYQTGKCNINNAVRGVTKSTCGYLWSHEMADVYPGPQEEVVRRAYSTKLKPVYSYDKDGYFVRSYLSTKDASKELNIPSYYVSQCCAGVKKNLTAYGLFFSYTHKERLDVRPYGFSSLKKPVVQYDINGYYINEFESISEAARKNRVHSTGIYDVLNRKQNASNGFIWKYKKDVA